MEEQITLARQKDLIVKVIGRSSMEMMEG